MNPAPFIPGIFSSANFLPDSCELEKADWISHYTTLGLSSNESGADWMCACVSVRFATVTDVTGHRECWVWRGLVEINSVNVPCQKDCSDSGLIGFLCET